MALDIGKIDLQLLDSGKESDVAVVAPDLNYGPDLGAALRAVRQARGRSLQDIADQTRVRVFYLQALEEMRLADLPARPFTLGYVRSYAQVLGLNADQAVARFKLALPELDDELGDPIGVHRERDPRVVLIAAGGAVILLAIAGWSISQRLLTKPSQTNALAPAAPAPATPPASQAITLGAPTTPPTEATAPQPYVTPGLGVDPAAAPTAPGPATPPPNLGADFQAKGKVYGTPGSSLILQATRGGQTLIIRRGDATVFAQVMAAGEAYGAPGDPGLTAEVSDPGSFQVFAGGTLRGVMPAAITPLAKMAPPPPAPAAPVQTAAAPPTTAAAPRSASPAAARPPAPRPAAASPTPPPTTVY